MRTSVYYTKQSKQACNIHLIDVTAWADEYSKMSALEQNAMMLFGVKGAAGDVAVVVDAHGRPAKAYALYQGQSYAFALASAALRLPEGDYEVNRTITQADALYWALAQYQFSRYRKSEQKIKRLLVRNVDMDELVSLADSVFLTRDLINTPANDMGPKELLEVVLDLAKTHQAKVNHWTGDELLKAGFPAVHAVGRAAANAPRMIELIYGNPMHPKVALVGKGVCFDSGGLDLKPASGMRLMKKDMGGAAQVLGLAHAVMALKLPVHLHVYIPAVENSVGSQSFRPGDIISMRNGMTVEIDNTDAEGRLVLADALVKAQEDGCKLIIDFATLTGAARVAVGTELSAYFTDKAPLAQHLEEAAVIAQDPVWRLPLYKPYRPMIDSKVADLVNSTAQPYAGAITAGLFLKAFVADDIEWLHFDIMAWNIQSIPGKPEGGEAMGLRAVYLMLKQRFLDK